MAPSLDTRGVNAAVRAVAGDRVKFCFPCAGEPAPEIRWVREGDSGADEAEQGGNSIDILNAGCKTGPSCGTTSVLGHYNFRHVLKLHI